MILLPEPMTTEPLMPRLPVVMAGNAAFANASYGAAVISTAEGSIGFASSQAFERAGIVLDLAGDDLRMWLTVQADALPEILEGALQAGLPAELLLALTQAEYAQPLQLLEQMFGCPLSLRSVNAPASAQTPMAYWAGAFGWWNVPLLPRPTAAFALRGVDERSNGAMRYRLHQRRAVPSMARVRDLPLEVTLCVDAGGATPSDIQSLRIGNGIVLSASEAGGRHELSAALRLQRRRRAGDRLTVAKGCIRGRSFFPREVTPMNEYAQQHSESLGNEIEAALEIDVHCELARWPMSLDEIARLAPGMVVDLSSSLDGLRATLRAGGRAVAMGEVVMAGDHVALRITELAKPTH